MVYTIHNPDCKTHSLTFTAKNNKEALNIFLKQAKTVGFFSAEILKITKEFEENEFIHVEVSEQ